MEIGEEDGLKEGEAGGVEGKCGQTMFGLTGSGPIRGGFVFQVGLWEEQKHLEIDCEGDAMYKHSYHQTRNHMK